MPPAILFDDVERIEGERFISRGRLHVNEHQENVSVDSGDLGGVASRHVYESQVYGK